MKLENMLIPRSKRSILIFYGVIAVLSLFFAVGITNVETDNDVTVLLPKNEETEFEREKLTRLNKEFPSDQMLFIAVTHPENDGLKTDKTVFTPEYLKPLARMCREIDKLPSVKSTMHPFNSTYFKKIGDTFSIARTGAVPATDKAAKEMVDLLSSNSFLTGSVISYSRNTAGIVVRMNQKATTGEDREKPGFLEVARHVLFGRPYGKQPITREMFCKEVENVIHQYDKTFRIYYSGVPVYEAKTKEYMQRDMFILLIPAILMMALTLFLTNRTKRGTVLPMISMMLSLLWTIGLVGWARYKLNVLGVLMPPIILTIGSSYTLHYLHSYNHHAVHGGYTDIRKLIWDSTRDIFPTIILASLTTIVGFASFFTASIGAIVIFALLIIISILFTLFFTFFLLPKPLLTMEKPAAAQHQDARKDLVSHVIHGITTAAPALRYLWIAVFIAVGVIFALTISNLKVETNAANFFKNSDNVKQSIVFLQKEFGGTTGYTVTIRSKDNRKNYFKTLEGLRAAEKVQNYFDRNVSVGGFTMIGWNISLVKLVKDFNRNIYGKEGFPEDEKSLKKFLSFIGSSRSKDDGVRSIVNSDFSAITFQVRTLTSNEKENGIMTEQELYKLTLVLNEELNKIAQEDGTFTAEIWGEVMLLSRISKYLIDDQIKNIIGTLIFVFVIVLIVFRSLFYSLLSITSLAFGVMSNFMVMSIFRIPLDTGTIMIAAIAIGVGVDAAIHFILNYRKIVDTGIAPTEAVKKTIVHTSRPILFAGLALMLGFLVFILSSFRPVFYFGLLIALAMLTCTFANLFILPSLLIVLDKLRKPLDFSRFFRSKQQ